MGTKLNFCTGLTVQDDLIRARVMVRIHGSAAFAMEPKHHAAHEADIAVLQTLQGLPRDCFKGNWDLVQAFMGVSYEDIQAVTTLRDRVNPGVLHPTMTSFRRTWLASMGIAADDWDDGKFPENPTPTVKAIGAATRELHAMRASDERDAYTMACLEALKPMMSHRHWCAAHAEIGLMPGELRDEPRGMMVKVFAVENNGEHFSHWTDTADIEGEDLDALHDQLRRLGWAMVGGGAAPLYRLMVGS